MALINLPHS